MNVMRNIAFVWIIGLVLSANTYAQGSIPKVDPYIAVKLSSSAALPDLRIYGVKVNDIILVGRQTAIEHFLSSYEKVSFGSPCECHLALSPGACIVRTGTIVPIPSFIKRPRLNKVKVVAHTENLEALLAAANRQPPANPPIIPPVPPKTPADISCASSECEPTGSVTVSTDGEVGVTLGCDDGVEVEISTSGEVSISVGAGIVHVEHKVLEAPSK